jgi:dolichol kinase
MHLWLRKSWHLLGNLIPLIYLHSSLSSLQAALIVFIFFLCSFSIDLLRLKVPAFNQWFLTYFGILVKEKEKHSFTGSTYYFLAISLTLLIFPKIIAVCAVFYLTLGDPIAAIVGHYFPIRRIWQRKSLGGSLANFFICLAIGILFFPIFIAFLGAIIATLAELFSPIDDALSIPLLSAFVLYLFT